MHLTCWLGVSCCGHCRPHQFTAAMSHHGDMTRLQTAASHWGRIRLFSSHQRTRIAFIQTQTFHFSQINTQTFAPIDTKQCWHVGNPSLYERLLHFLSLYFFFVCFECTLGKTCIHIEPLSTVETDYFEWKVLRTKSIRLHFLNSQSLAALASLHPGIFPSLLNSQ